MRIKGFDKGTNVGEIPGTRLQIELPITRVARLGDIDHVCTVYSVHYISFQKKTPVLTWIMLIFLISIVSCWLFLVNSFYFIHWITSQLV